MKTKAVYAGSFDPPTLGHEWVVNDQRFTYGELVVAVGVNPEKAGRRMFMAEESMNQLRSLFKNYENVSVATFSGFLVPFAREIGATHLLRGMRDEKDFREEMVMLRANRLIDMRLRGSARPLITSYAPPAPDIANLGSSEVKGMIGPPGWEEMIRDHVSEQIRQEIIKKVKEKTAAK